LWWGFVVIWVIYGTKTLYEKIRVPRREK